MSNKLEVYWSKIAANELSDIVDYWNFRNKSTSYSDKLRRNLAVTIKILSLHPHIGKPSKQKQSVRIKVFMKNYLIIYRVTENKLFFLDFWDTRKDPSKSKYI